MKEGESVDLRCHLGPAEVQWDFCVWEQVVFIYKSLTDENNMALCRKKVVASAVEDEVKKVNARDLNGVQVAT